MAAMKVPPWMAEMKAWDTGFSIYMAPFSLTITRPVPPLVNRHGQIPTTRISLRGQLRRPTAGAVAAGPLRRPRPTAGAVAAGPLRRPRPTAGAAGSAGCPTAATSRSPVRWPVPAEAAGPIRGCRPRPAPAAAAAAGEPGRKQRPASAGSLFEFFFGFGDRTFLFLFDKLCN
jgi:hypothetical protein